jgi:hypothetical protein
MHSLIISPSFAHHSPPAASCLDSITTDIIR